MPNTVTRIFAPVLAAPVLAAVVLASPVPAMAQDDVSEARVRKIEAEIRALQRKVFPGGDGRFFEPQIGGGAQTDSASTNTSAAPSTTAVTDILARLDAMEAQLQRLTATNEENTNAIAGLQSRIAILEGTRTAATTGSTTTVPVGTSTGAATTPATQPAASQPSAAETNLSAMSGGQSSSASQPAGPTAERLAAVQAIAKPQTDDAADDEYSYGFRLWDAGFFPEAQQQLSLFVEKYPGHWRTTYGRNLLGRAYLDDNKPREAAPWFLRNYQSDKSGARAGDSLLYLAEAMIAMKDTNRACIALAEFSETYPALATGRLKSEYDRNRAKVTCN